MKFSFYFRQSYFFIDFLQDFRVHQDAIELYYIKQTKYIFLGNVSSYLESPGLDTHDLVEAVHVQLADE